MSASGDRNVDLVNAIMVEGRINIPVGQFITGKSAFALCLWFISDGLSAKGSHSSGVKVKDTKNLMIGREFRIDTRGMKKVDS